MAWLGKDINIMGLLLTLLTGLVWGGIGLVANCVARRGIPELPFVSSSALLSAIGAWAFLVHWPTLASGHLTHTTPLLIIMSLAGIIGTVGTIALQKAMVAGASAWTVGQSAMIIPFLYGVLVLREPLQLAGWLGMVAIALSLAAFAGSRRSVTTASTQQPQPWFTYAIIALALLGIQQTLTTIPSRWVGWHDLANLRVPILLATGAIPMLMLSARRRQWPERTAWGLASLYALLVIAGQLLMFAAMDALRIDGQLALAYPVAIGLSMTVVAMGDIIIWRQRPSGAQLAGMLLGLSGVIVLAL